jgi:hypothetical protein
LLTILATGLARAADPTVPEKPGAPSLRVIGTDSLNVNWDTPDDGGSEIRRFVVEYYRAGEDFSISKFVDADQVRPIRIGGLVANATYSVRIAAGNDVGLGEYSDETRVTIVSGGYQSGDVTTTPVIAESGSSKLPRQIGSTGAATATEIEGDRVVITRHDIAGQSLELGVGWIAKDGSSQVVVGIIRDIDLGKTYIVVRYEDTGRIVRRWVAPSSPLVYSIPWDTVNAQYSVPVGVVGSIPLGHRFPEPNQLARRFDGGDSRIFAYDAAQGKWRHVPNIATFQALGFYWCNITAADPDFFNRTVIGDPYPATSLPERANYPQCLTS